MYMHISYLYIYIHVDTYSVDIHICIDIDIDISNHDRVWCFLLSDITFETIQTDKITFRALNLK